MILSLDVICGQGRARTCPCGLVPDFLLCETKWKGVLRDGGTSLVLGASCMGPTEYRQGFVQSQQTLGISLGPLMPLDPSGDGPLWLCFDHVLQSFKEDQSVK